MKEIVFSDHALLKFEVLQKHGVILDKNFVEGVLRNPSKIERGYKERFIAQGKLDDEHVLRVVYEEHGDHMLVITFYPGRIVRYETN